MLTPRLLPAYSLSRQLRSAKTGWCEPWKVWQHTSMRELEESRETARVLEETARNLVQQAAILRRQAADLRKEARRLRAAGQRRGTKRSRNRSR